MRTERNRDGTFNVWMSRNEYRELPRQAHSGLAEVALRLMGDCGLRVAEVPDVTAEDISRRSDGRHYELRVTGAKDTTGTYEGGKYRETWLPVDLEAHINRIVQQPANEIEDGDSVVRRSKRTLQNWMERAAAGAAEETGDEDYRKVSTHDLRRCWAHHLLVEEGVSPRIVMALGGWSSYDAIEPYLAAPTEENINREMQRVEL
jgi:integrase